MLSVFLFCVFFSVWFLSFAVFWQSSLLLRAGFCEKFSGANFCFCSLFGSVCFWYGFAYGFRVFSRNFAPEMLKKILLMSGLVRFCLVLSVLGFGLTTSCVLSLFLLFFVQETKLRSNRTPHPPPHLLLFFLFFSPPLCFVSPVLAVRPFCSGVSSGCHSGPRAFFGFSRDCSEAFFWTRGGRGVCSFFGLLFFPFCGFTRF